MTNIINAPVSVSSYYFAGRQMKTFPRRIEFENQAVTFMTGLRYLVEKGGQAVRLFDMNGEDGRTYRLREVNGGWTLLGTSGGAQ